jgi:hypothetical protein
MMCLERKMIKKLWLSPFRQAAVLIDGLAADDDSLLNFKINLSGLEKLCPAQPEPQRVLHQAAQGSGEARQGPLLDHRPRLGVHVRGGLVPASASRIQAKSSQKFWTDRLDILSPGPML